MIVGGLAWQTSGLCWLIGVARAYGRSVRWAFFRWPGSVAAALGLGLQAGTLAFDDWWHRSFGLDVTLWSPPHLGLLLFGSLCTMGAGLELHLSDASSRVFHWWAGASMGFGTIFLAEYDFGVPQFGAVWYAPVQAVLLGFWLGFGLRGKSLGPRAAFQIVGTALGLRLVGVLWNFALGQAVPTIPISILVAGACCCLLSAVPVKLGLRWPLPVTVGVSWIIGLTVDSLAQPLVGRFWTITGLLVSIGVVSTVTAGAASAVGHTAGRLVSGYLVRAERMASQ